MDNIGYISIDWQNRQLKNSNGITTVDWSISKTIKINATQVVSINANVGGSLISGSYSIQPGDYIVAVDTLTVTSTIYLPTSPLDGETYLIKDATGSGSFNNISVDAGLFNIDGSASPYVINTNRGIVRLTWFNNQGSWLIV